MTIHFSDHAKGILPVPMPAQAGQVTAYRAKFTVPTDIVEGDIIDMCPLPPGCRLVDAILDADDLDSGTPDIVLDVGLMTGKPGDAVDEAGDPRACGNQLFDGTTLAGQGTTSIARPVLKAAQRITPTDDYRSIGIKLVTDAAVAVQGEIGLTLFYVA